MSRQHPLDRLLIFALVLLPALIPSTAGDSSPAPAPAIDLSTDPIEQVLSERLAAGRSTALPPGSSARLKLDVLEVTPGAGVRLVGKFSAPLDPERPARLSRRVELSGQGSLEPATLALQTRVGFRPISETRSWFTVETRVRLAETGQPEFVRTLQEEVTLGRSAVFEAFQLPGTLRRLMLALSWEIVAPDPLEAALAAPTRAPSPRMVDLLVELIRTEKGAAETIRRERLSAGLGSEVLTMMRLVPGPWGKEPEQSLEVRLTPRNLDAQGLQLGIQVRGTLETEGDSPPLWIDHSDDARLKPGRHYSLELGEEPQTHIAYRLEIQPLF